MRSYFYTSDNYDSASLWMPVIKGTLSLPINWTLRYIVPHDHIMVSSGNLTSRTTEATESKRTLFIYKLKDEEKAIAGKIGFVLGNFPYMYKS